MVAQSGGWLGVRCSLAFIDISRRIVHDCALSLNLAVILLLLVLLELFKVDGGFGLDELGLVSVTEVYGQGRRLVQELR